MLGGVELAGTVVLLEGLGSRAFRLCDCDISAC